MKKGTPRKRVCRSLIQKLKLSFAVGLIALLADTAGASISNVEALLNQAEYSRAIDAINVDFKNTDLSQKDRIHLHWLKALCHVSLDQTQLAKTTLRNLFAIDPSFQPDANSSPKILNLIKSVQAKAKENALDEAQLKKSTVQVEPFVSGESLPFRIHFEDSRILGRLTHVELHLRRLGNSEFSTLDFRRVDDNGNYEAIIPPILTRNFQSEASFEYYIDVVSSDGTRVASLGKPGLPLHFAVSAKESERSNEELVDKPNFLRTALVIGAVAATIGGVILAVLVLSTPQEGSLNLKVYLQNE